MSMARSPSRRSVRIVSARRALLLRRGAPDGDGRRPLRTIGKKGGGPDLVMAGELSVSDSEVFSAMLARGGWTTPCFWIRHVTLDAST
jgi:hypothetical protein